MRWSLTALASLSVAGSVAFVACGSSPKPPPAGDTGEGGIPSKDGSSAESASSSGGGGDDGGGDAGGDAADATSEPPPIPQPQCTEGAWSTATAIASIPSTTFHRFGAVSATGTTVAWTDTGGAIMVADRASATDSFGTPQAIDASTTPVADDRIAMTPDGLELLATKAARTSFTTFVRPSVGAAWAPGQSTAELKYIAAMISEVGGSFSEPVISADGLSFFYLLSAGTAAPVLYESAWDPGLKAWDEGNSVAGADFVNKSTTSVRRPTGVSEDRRTLFFFDETVGNERVAWRNYPTSPFFFFDDLPLAPEAAPLATCVTLYIQSGETDAGGTPGIATFQ
jgi:hypothetical protein